MKAALFLAVLAVPGLAQAQTARVKAGDHADFTRLVIDLPEAADWRLGRTPGGYELRLSGPAVRYDLSQVFRVITKDRLAAIFADPDTGNLQIQVDCACHAAPFLFRPDIVVIDLRDGPPATGSQFELALDGSRLPALTARALPVIRPRPAPNRPEPPQPEPNRLATIRPAPRPDLPEDQLLAAAQAAPLPLPPGGESGLPAVPFGLAPEVPEPTLPGVQAMRGELLRELGRAATAGVIDVEDPSFPPPGPETEEAGTGVAAHLSVNGVPGLQATPVNTPGLALTAEGEVCLPDGKLDVASWGDDRPFVVQMAEAREKLLGEFDRPDPASLEKLVRLNLFFGFGAEARNLLTSFGTEFPDAALWTAMAHVVDDQAAPPDSPLAGQLACEGNVALWATLAEPVLKPGVGPRAESVALAFSALPLHLRRHLGAALAEKMMSIGDISTAQAIRDAIWRAPGPAGPDAMLLDAKLDAARGDLALAADKQDAVRKEGGPGAAQAVVDLVDTNLAMGQPVDAGTIAELGALVNQYETTALEAPLRRAEMLAMASAGDYAGAFDRAPKAGPEAEAELWAMLASTGQDSALLENAVLADTAPVPQLDSAVRKQIADRLLALGFAEQTLRWLPETADEATLLTAARAELQRGDARMALRSIAGLQGAEASRVRAEALERLGDQAAAARAFDAAGDDLAEASALWRAQDWQASATVGSEPVRAALETLSPEAPVSLPQGNAPLAEGRALIAESEKAREAILSLLGATPSPAQP